MGPAKQKKPAGETEAERKKKVAQGSAAVTCAICGQAFGATAKVDVLKEHYESKHEAKKMHTIAQCFPNTTFP